MNKWQVLTITFVILAIFGWVMYVGISKEPSENKTELNKYALLDEKIRHGFSPTTNPELQMARCCIEYHGDLYIGGVGTVWKLDEDLELEKVAEEAGRSHGLRFYHDDTDKIASAPT